MKITIKEIAELAGVHRSTVDKVIHNRVGVSDEVRQKVQKIIDQSGYTPNPAGRILSKQGRTYRLAAVLVDVDAKPYLIEGMEQGVCQQAEFDIDITYYSTVFQDIEGQKTILEHLIEDKVDGIIVSPIHSAQIATAINKAVDAGIPVVTVDSDIPNCKRMCFVGQNAKQASEVAGRLMGLLLGGIGEVGVVTSSIEAENNNFYVRVREQGFLDFLAEKFPGIRVVECIESFEDAKITYQKTLQLIERHPDLQGIYVTCGGAAEVGRALQTAKKTQRVKIICFEDYPEILELIEQEAIVCTLGGQLQRQGRLPIQILMEYLVFKRMPQEAFIFTHTNIIVKENIAE